MICVTMGTEITAHNCDDSDRLAGVTEGKYG